jgi:hypothetical protein
LVRVGAELGELGHQCNFRGSHHATEAARVDKAELVSAGQGPHDVGVAGALYPGVLDAQPAGHAEVDKHRAGGSASTLEVDEDVLGAAGYGAHPCTAALAERSNVYSAAQA